MDATDQDGLRWCAEVCWSEGLHEAKLWAAEGLLTMRSGETEQHDAVFISMFTHRSIDPWAQGDMLWEDQGCNYWMVDCEGTVIV